MPFPTRLTRPVLATGVVLASTLASTLASAAAHSAAFVPTSADATATSAEAKKPATKRLSAFYGKGRVSTGTRPTTGCAKQRLKISLPVKNNHQKFNAQSMTADVVVRTAQGRALGRSKKVKFSRKGNASVSVRLCAKDAGTHTVVLTGGTVKAKRVKEFLEVGVSFGPGGASTPTMKSRTKVSHTKFRMKKATLGTFTVR